MQKISNVVMQKMINANLTSLEINFILVIARVQADDGTVEGVYYKDIIEQLSCSVQQFYNMLTSLQEKGIIECHKASYYDYDIRILDNVMENEYDRKHGYISLSKGLFCEEFMELKAGEKLLAMELLRRQDIQFKKLKKPSLCFNVDTLYEKFCGMLQVTARVLRQYLKSLKEFFSIGIKDGKYYITPLKRSYSPDTGIDAPSDADRYNEHVVKVDCRRQRIDTEGYGPESLKETARLIKQYGIMAIEKGMDIVTLVRQSISESVDKAGTYKAQKRRLEYKLVHKIVRQHIDSGIMNTNEDAAYPEW